MKRIINLSFQRNATQSVSKMIDSAGIPGIHHITLRNHSSNYRGFDLESIQEMIEVYEDEFIHFADAPYFMMYDYFYNKYPDSKFILVKRDPQIWLKSFKKLYSTVPIDPVSRACFEKYLPKIKAIMDDEIIKIPDNDILFMYNLHNLKVEKYFKDKKNLLVLDINEIEDRMKEIGIFLDIDLVYNEYNIDFIRKMVK